MNNDELKWEALDDNRLLAEHKLGFSIIIMKDDKKAISLECDICTLLMRDQKDVQAYNECSACYDCMLQWYEPQQEKWNSGWRPPVEEVMLERKKRLLVPSYLIT